MSKDDLPTYYECGICGAHHRLEWDGDCRDDRERFDADELDRRHGALGWAEVPMEEVDDWRRAEGPAASFGGEKETIDGEPAEVRALRLLREARDLLVASDHERAAERVRAAIRSAEDARRHGVAGRFAADRKETER